MESVEYAFIDITVCSLGPRVIVPRQIRSTGKIDLSLKYLHSIGPCAKIKKTQKQQLHKKKTEIWTYNERDVQTPKHE